MNKVTLCENALDPSTWELHEDVTDVPKFLLEHFGIWPDTARIYLDHVANNADITPHDDAGVERLSKVTGHFFVVVYPEGIETILLIIALVVAATAIALTFIFRPSIKKGLNEDSANNQLSNRTNQARPDERIPDIYGELWATFDLLAVPYRTFESNQEVEHCYMCIGRGEYDIDPNNIRDDISPLIAGLGDVIDTAGTSVGVYGPNKSPNRPDTPDIQIGSVINEKVFNLQPFTLVNGQIVRAPNLDTFYGSGDIQFTNAGEIHNSTARDFTEEFAVGDQITIGGFATNDDLAVDPGGIQPSVHLNGEYIISGLSSDTIQLANPSAVNLNWTALAAFAGAQSTFRSINLIANGAFKVGPFTIINPSMTKFWCNFVAPQGMYIIDKNGNQIAWAANIRVRVTQCDPSGTPIDAGKDYVCVVGGNKTDRLPKGTTLKISISPKFGFGGIIVEAERTTNTDPASRGNTVVDQVQWRDAYIISDVAQLDFGNVTTVQTRTLPTLAALAIKERKMNALVTRKIPHWTGVGTVFSANVATKNAADILCAMALDTFIGNRVASELDLVNIYGVAGSGGEIEMYFSNAQMTEFCYTFDDSKVSFEESVGDLAQAIFCVAYRRGNVLSLSFEKLTGNSVLLFNHRNKIPKSETRTVSFGSVNDNDGINLDYIEPNAPNYPNIDTTVTLYFPANQSAKNPKKLTAIGVRNKAQALAIGGRLYNKILYQNVVVEFDSTEEAAMLVLQDRILVADNTRSDTQDGEVLAQAVLLLTLSQKVVFDGIHAYTIFLQNPDGTVDSRGITAGPNPNQVVLASAPTLPCVVDPAMFARTTYIIVSNAPVRSSAFLLTEKAPKDGKTYSVKAVNYDDHYYDNDLLGTTPGVTPSSLFMPTTRGVFAVPFGGQPTYGTGNAFPDSGEIDQWQSSSTSFFNGTDTWDYSPAGVYAAPGGDAIGTLPRAQISKVLAVVIFQQKYDWIGSVDVSVDGGATWHGIGNASNFQTTTRLVLDITALLGAIATFDFTQVKFRASFTTSLNFNLFPDFNFLKVFEIGLAILFNGADDNGSADGFGSGPGFTSGYQLIPSNPLSQTSAIQIAMVQTLCDYFPDNTEVTFNARVFAIADPGAVSQIYYVTIFDPHKVGDSLGTLTDFIGTTKAAVHWGEAGYVNIGSILAIHGTSNPGDGSGDGTGNGDGGTTFRFLLTPALHGDFSFAHGLSVVPKEVRIGNTSDGAIRFQAAPSPPWDITNIYLNASDDGLTGFLEITV